MAPIFARNSSGSSIVAANSFARFFSAGTLSGLAAAKLYFSDGYDVMLLTISVCGDGSPAQIVRQTQTVNWFAIGRRRVGRPGKRRIHIDDSDHPVHSPTGLDVSRSVGRSHREGTSVVERPRCHIAVGTVVDGDLERI